ncbi:hypothetical protein PTKIN_Ptkin01aG0352900 [Pterospermum kingtungense]
MSVPCHSCGEVAHGIIFGCWECNVVMHYSCANYKIRKIKHECHGHDLLHMGKVFSLKHFPGVLLVVKIVGTPCSAASSAILHVKHIRCMHPLTLASSVVEDDSGENYCDICEMARNPEHDVYYCEECKYIAHIDCVISDLLFTGNGFLTVVYDDGAMEVPT